MVLYLWLGSAVKARREDLASVHSGSVYSINHQVFILLQGGERQNQLT